MQSLLWCIALAGPLIGLIFGTHGAWQGLESQYSAAIASLVVAGAYIGIGSICALVLLIRANQKKPEAKPETRSSLPSPLRTVGKAMEHSPMQTTALLVGFGMLLAKKPQLAALAAQQILSGSSRASS